LLSDVDMPGSCMRLRVFSGREGGGIVLRLSYGSMAPNSFMKPTNQ
jgi:hypothetical protein